jgi:hypothetical protein
MPGDAWHPVRHVPKGVRCVGCFELITAGGPGASKGTRGTKAWYDPKARYWMCLKCRDRETQWLTEIGAL